MSSEQQPYVLLLTGAAGYIGQQLARALVSQPFVHPLTSAVVPLDLTLVDVVKAPIPPSGRDAKTSIEALEVDLTKQEQVNSLVARKRVDGAFILHGIMSGASEKDFDFGMTVRTDWFRSSKPIKHN
jgi:nucleoside-diphosphate-sugar epimerase